jgi:hypothetical protein
MDLYELFNIDQVDIDDIDNLDWRLAMATVLIDSANEAGAKVINLMLTPAIALELAADLTESYLTKSSTGEDEDDDF